MWGVIFGVLACSVALLVLFALISFALVARPMTGALVSAALSAGGERKNYFAKLRGTGLAFLLLGLFLLVFALPRGAEPHDVVMRQLKLGIAAIIILVLATICLCLWWVLAGRKVAAVQDARQG